MSFKKKKKKIKKARRAFPSKRTAQAKTRRLETGCCVCLGLQERAHGGREARRRSQMAGECPFTTGLPWPAEKMEFYPKTRKTNDGILNRRITRSDLCFRKIHFTKGLGWL